MVDSFLRRGKYPPARPEDLTRQPNARGARAHCGMSSSSPSPSPSPGSRCDLVSPDRRARRFTIAKYVHCRRAGTHTRTGAVGSLPPPPRRNEARRRRARLPGGGRLGGQDQRSHGHGRRRHNIARTEDMLKQEGGELRQLRGGPRRWDWKDSSTSRHSTRLPRL